jgi:uncharacterized repeat protein (TIGR03803 family)
MNTLQIRTTEFRLLAVISAFTVASILAIATPSVQAQKLSVLYNFGGAPDAANPWSGVIDDASGTLYGTTLSGGTSGEGAIFAVDSTGKETVLHSFSGSDGEVPYAGLVLDKSGNLYGTTAVGGSANHGTIFKLSPKGKLTVLHNFAGGSADGCYPLGGVLMDASGNLYGTTASCGGSGYGTLWKFSKSGKLTIVYNFRGGKDDGEEPEFGSLLMDKQGNLYGFTILGGPSNDGVVYEYSKSGKESVLYSFKGDVTDGCYPQGTPAMDSAGSIYGVAQMCGSTGNGTVWKLTRSGKETVLHNFDGGSEDGISPYAGVILDSKGNLYGTTEEGGSSNDGVVFELSKASKFSLLHAFDGSDGALLLCSLLRDSKGNLYGTANSGGTNGNGTVWKLTP